MESLDILKDEEAAYRKVLEIRSQFRPELFAKASSELPKNPKDAFIRASSVTLQIFSHLETLGIPFNRADPGHGIGHWVRDLINAHLLLSALEFKPAHILAGMAGGALHDVGCAFVHRYRESSTPLRHAEVAGLVLEQIFSERDFGLTRAQMLLIQWAVMAHTLYLAPQKVMWRGRELMTEPYLDLDKDRRPLYGVWITRWIDSFETHGSETFPARHWITLSEEREDFNDKQFFSVKFSNHVRPILRTLEEIERDDGNYTMLEHLRRFANDQTTYHRKYDCGRASKIMDSKRKRMRKFIHEVSVPSKLFTEEERICVLKKWTFFLSNVIEPSQAGLNAAKKLERMFSSLDPKTQNAWCNGFTIAIRDYEEWRKGLIRVFDRQGLALDLYNLPFVGNRVISG